MRFLVTVVMGLAGACLPDPGEAAPKRVVSMNLCTDQLAMLIAPEQVISVSYLASDPRSSAMVQQARAYPANHGLAEEIFMLKPDLVIAGTYTTRATVELLRKLEIPVVAFAPSDSLDDVRSRVSQMGEVMGQEDRASALIRRFDQDLAAARAGAGEKPRAATYYANSYTSGPGTLAGAILDAAGLANIAIELGLDRGGTIALEELVMKKPDLIITGHAFDTPALAEEILRHPALINLRRQADTAPVADRDWICGTPFVIAAIRRLVAARNAVLAR